ncbi:MAG: hypothetical protein JO360_13035 [Acidobacteria bacterium]|nr:hypothetical protein [Acidobacteriota bacterium]
MFELTPLRQKNSVSRAALAALLATSLFVMSGCASLFGVKQTVSVPPRLGPLSEATMAELIAEVNRIATVRSIRGKVDIEFQDTSFAENGLTEKYRTADGTVILQRPNQINLRIQAPLIATNIAEMTSDGQQFRVAVLQGDEKYRRFVRGTNNAVYPKLTVEDGQSGGSGKNKKGMNDKRTVSALSNLRPQHLTEALLVRPIQSRDESGYVYAQSEFYQEEADKGPRAKKGNRVVRGYYLLDELAPGGAGGVRLMRRFWFDRVGGIRLARMQTYDTKGSLTTDVEYGEQKSFGEDGRLKLPGQVELTRPQDGYKLRLSYQAPEAVIIDRQYDADIFLLENKWQLPEVDLDKRQSGNISQH